MKRLLPVLATAIVLAGPSYSQDREAGSHAFSPELQSMVVESDPTLHFRTQRRQSGRMDLDAGVLRAAYRLQWDGAVSATPELTARTWMEANGDSFGWASAKDLVLIDQVRTPHSAHLTYQQTFRGVPVHRRTVKVNLGPDGLPTMVFSTYAPHLKSIDVFDTTPSVSPEQARQQVQLLIAAADVTTSDPELVVYPLADPVLAWRLIAWSSYQPGEWEVLLNAHSAQIIHLLDQARRYRHPDITRAGRSPSSRTMRRREST